MKTLIWQHYFSKQWHMTFNGTQTQNWLQYTVNTQNTQQEGGENLKTLYEWRKTTSHLDL